jgi:hypothetical protein
VYVPSARVTAGFAFTCTAYGVDAQHPNALGAIVSQLPPVVDVAVAVNVKFAPVLATVNICGNASFPPNVLLKLKAGIGSNVCAQPLTGRARTTVNTANNPNTQLRIPAQVAIASLSSTQKFDPNVGIQTNLAT